jgi:outer membrane protein assembly factor BamD
VLYNIGFKRYFEENVPMRIAIYASGALLLTLLTTGCSSVSMPSMPWSKSAPVADPTAEALFAEGNKYFQEKRYVRAIDAFTKLKTEHPFSPLVTEAELKIADGHYLNEQYVEAVNAFKEFQNLHPSSEHIPFIVLRLGQAHFNQFTDINRDQKNTEIAKGYFEAVLANYPNSPHVAEAREKLGKCNGILAEHEFNIAAFYFKQEKYPAARDRFEEIVRKYRGTPVASRSLFFLGESYRLEKNSIKAALAYEALLEHYPNDPLAGSARTQLAQLDKSKHDPLAMLLMRDRRPVVLAEAAETKAESKSAAKLRESNNLVAKTEVVYEAPGVEKGLFTRVVQKINPFSASENDKKKEEAKEEKPKSAVELLAKNNKASNNGSKGFFASLWPFGSDEAKEAKGTPRENETLVARIDDSLKQQGIDAKAETADLKAPAVDLPKVDDLEPKPQVDTSKLLEQIDANLKKAGKSAAELPEPPEAAAAFKDAAATQTAIARSQAKTESEQSAATSGLLSSIDQKLKGQGIEPGKFEPAPAVTQSGAQAQQQQPVTPKEINLEPKRVVEKGPLFLSPVQVPAIEQSSSASNPAPKTESLDKPEEPATREIPKDVLVRNPQAPGAPPAKTTEQNKPATKSEDESKGGFDQLRQDVESVGKLLNPFRW